MNKIIHRVLSYLYYEDYRNHQALGRTESHASNPVPIHQSRDTTGALHSYLGNPAVVWSDGRREWYKHGEKVG